MKIFIELLNRIKALFLTPEELKIPLIPKCKLPGKTFKDFSLKNRYKTNIISMTCGCPEFQQYQHNRYALDDIRRMCKHLIDLYKNTVNYSSVTKINKAIIENGFSIRGNYRIIEVMNNKTGEVHEVGITSNRDNPWIDVFSEDETSTYRRYGYSIKSLYWAKNEKPPNIAEAIEDMLKRNY